MIECNLLPKDGGSVLWLSVECNSILGGTSNNMFICGHDAASRAVPRQFHGNAHVFITDLLFDGGNRLPHVGYNSGPLVCIYRSNVPTIGGNSLTGRGPMSSAGGSGLGLSVVYNSVLDAYATTGSPAASSTATATANLHDLSGGGSI